MYRFPNKKAGGFQEEEGEDCPLSLFYLYVSGHRLQILSNHDAMTVYRTKTKFSHAPGLVT